MSIWDDSDGPDGSPRPPEKRERAGGRLVLAVVLLLVLLVGGGWAAAYATAGDKVPRGATVAGVDIGGRTQDAAVVALEDGLADRATRPIPVSIDGATQQVDPANAGLGVDYVASVAEAGGERTWRPDRLWDYFTGGDDLDAVVTLDEATMSTLVDELTTGLGATPRDGAVRFVDGRAHVRKPRLGQGLDPTATRDALLAAYLTDETVELTTTRVAPDIDADDVQDALDDFANPALSAPVRLIFGKSLVSLSPGDYADALSLEPEGGRLVPAVDEAMIARLVGDATGDRGTPVDATVRLVDGEPKVIPAKPGVRYDPADVTEAFLKLVTMPEGKRELEVEATVDDADFTTKDAKALKIREKVSEFTTYFPYAEYRNTNIGRAAELIDGTILKPGETFSLNDTTGERTRANGFTKGFIISDGIFKEELGGGVSQMATTTFNAMFFAGLEDVEHKTHSFYIDRYPVGREATVAFGSVDLRFRNDTEYGVLINAEVTPSTPATQGVVTVRMYSTKVWDIETTTSDLYAYVPPKTRTLRTRDCYPNTGYSGFQVDVERIFHLPGEDTVDHVEKFHTDYTPSDTVICK